ncbi:MAG: hypothetical protein HN341_10885 [Verrucomicrobia bacterium]|jgi:hypothetical protein|nr:hypothetical protein [Verrucomicrobiota bacterium]
MKSFLAILVVTIADIAAAVIGFCVLLQGVLLSMGMFYPEVMGTMPWHISILYLMSAFIFFVPDALFRFMCRTLSPRVELVLSSCRAVAAAVIIIFLFISIGVVMKPHWAYLLALSRPLSAFALALKLETLYTQANSEQPDREATSEPAPKGAAPEASHP